MDSKDSGVSHTRAESMVLATLGHKDIGVSGFAGLRIGRACGVVKTGGTGRVGRAAGGGKAGKAGGAGKLGELGELGELGKLEARAGGESSPA